MSNSSDVANISIKADNKNTTTFMYKIKYIDDFTFEIMLDILTGKEVNLVIFNKHGTENFSILFNNKNNINTIKSSFKLIKETSEYIGKIPKIIHQSYTSSMLPRLTNATYTWQLINNNYKYMYWTDEACDDYIYKNFDQNINDAYFSLYARAYKSDIFRLCVLYEYGGVWCDISSECLYALDNLLNNDIDLLIVKDNPSQVTNGNIYQAFIAVEPRNEIIKHILDLTVDRVLNFSKYDTLHPWIHNETIAVTGPTIFAIALNDFLQRPRKNIFHDKCIEINTKKIFLLDHVVENNVGYIRNNNLNIIRTKYENFKKDRTTPHYSQLFSKGYILKNKIPLIDVENIKESSNNLFQMWISENKYGNNFVTSSMYYCHTTWKTINPDINYIFLSNDTIIKLIENETKFPNLLEAYNSVKVFAFKADLIRYYLLYKYGGTYVDIDSYCINPIKEITDGFDIVFSYDCDKTSISQAFMYSKNPREEIFELLVNSCIKNILSKNTLDGDTGITGPKLFGKVAQKLLNYLQKGSEFTHNNLKIKIINYTLHLPLPKGSWIKSSTNTNISGNLLTTHCRKPSGGFIKNIIRFLPHDIISNNNGRLIGNTNTNFSFSEGSGFYIYNNKVYCVSKYAGYNIERHILGGNDFANMFSSNNIFN